MESHIDKECTFSPQLESFYDSNLFSKNPIKNDSLVVKEMERNKTARMEKEINSILMTRGHNSQRTLTNIKIIVNDINNKKALPEMKFSNEQKTFKDSFSKFQNNPKKKKNAKFSSFYKSEVSFDKKRKEFSPKVTRNKPMTCTVSIDDHTEEEISQSIYVHDSIEDNTDNHLFTVELKMKNNVVERFNFYETDDPYLTTENFCLKFGLNDETKTKIIHLIEQKLKHFEA